MSSENGSSDSSGSGSPDEPADSAAPDDPVPHPLDARPERRVRRSDLGADLLAEIATEVPVEKGGDWAAELSADLEASPIDRELAAQVRSGRGAVESSVVIEAEASPALDLRAELRATAMRSSGPRGEIGAQRGEGPVDMRALLGSDELRPAVAPSAEVDMRALLDPSRGAALEAGIEPSWETAREGVGDSGGGQPAGAPAVASAEIAVDMRALLLEGRGAKAEPTAKIDREARARGSGAAGASPASAALPDARAAVAQSSSPVPASVPPTSPAPGAARPAVASTSSPVPATVPPSSTAPGALRPAVASTSSPVPPSSTVPGGARPAVASASSPVPASVPPSSTAPGAVRPAVASTSSPVPASVPPSSTVGARPVPGVAPSITGVGARPVPGVAPSTTGVGARPGLAQSPVAGARAPGAPASPPSPAAARATASAPTSSPAPAARAPARAPGAQSSSPPPAARTTAPPATASRPLPAFPSRPGTPGFADRSDATPELDGDTDVKVRAVAGGDEDDTIDRDEPTPSPSVIDAEADTGDVAVVPVADDEVADDLVEATPTTAHLQVAPPRAPGFVDGPVPKAVDPWTDVTPTDLPDDGEDALLERDRESTDVVRAHGSRAPFAAPDAKRAGVTRETMDMPMPREISAVAAELVEPPEIEVEPAAAAAEAEAYLGDGPFASPMDAPAKVAPKQKRLPPARTVSQLAREGFANAFSAPIAAQRRVPGRNVSQTGKKVDPSAQQTMLVPAMQSPARDAGRDPAASPVARTAEVPQPGERRYPRMRALLADPEAVPHGSGAPVKTRPPPVPGTFFPAPRAEKPGAAQLRAEPADLDEMLLTMAEGLLIGEDASGQTEVRVTLRDEFFAGTELRIVAGGGRVRAVLVPPDRGTYLTLNGNIDELRLRLEARGLKIEELRVAEP